LGEGGLGLDSIAMAEALLDCESRLGTEIFDEARPPATVGELIERITRA
jgi:acyl carrier protein